MATDACIASLDLGDHACVLFDRDEQLLAQTATFTELGLRHNHRVVICAERFAPAEIGQRMAERVPAFASAVARGQATVVACDDVQLAGGRFDPDTATAAFLATADAATRDGYAGLRVTADMAWTLRDTPGVARVFDFEATANRLFADGRFAAICQYDRRLFDPGTLARACAAHPVTPGQAVLRFALVGDPPVLRLRGEADLSNRDAFAAILDMVAGVDVTIDATTLVFADLDAAGSLVAAARRPGRRTELICRPAVARLLRMLGGDHLAVTVAEDTA